MRIFLDTNIVLDQILAREPWHIVAQPVWESIYSGKSEGIISAITPMNISYIVRKIIPSSDLPTLLYDLYEGLEIVSLDQSILRAGLLSPITDYEDAINELSAFQAAADVILTRDINDFKNARLPVFSPADFIKHYF